MNHCSAQRPPRTMATLKSKPRPDDKPRAAPSPRPCPGSSCLPGLAVGLRRSEPVGAWSSRATAEPAPAPAPAPELKLLSSPAKPDMVGNRRTKRKHSPNLGDRRAGSSATKLSHHDAIADCGEATFRSLFGEHWQFSTATSHYNPRKWAPTQAQVVGCHAEGSEARG